MLLSLLITLIGTSRFSEFPEVWSLYSVVLSQMLAINPCGPSLEFIESPKQPLEDLKYTSWMLFGILSVYSQVVGCLKGLLG